MFKLLAVFAVQALAAAELIQAPDKLKLDNAFDAGYLNTRMAGGSIVTYDEKYSYIVAIQPKYTEGTTTDILAPMCTGVLIEGTSTTGTSATKEYYILTSAHCALSGTSYDIYAGKAKISNLTATTTITGQSNVFVNEEYRADMLTADLALIKADDTLAPSTTNGLKTAVLAKIDDVSQSFLLNKVTMAGWGWPCNDCGENSQSLRELTSWVVPNWYCAVRHLTMPIKRTHMCTAGLPNKGPCTGDSGAPLIIGISSMYIDPTNPGRVIGLATHTPKAGCNQGKPGVFTRIGMYLNWIVRTTGYDADQ